MFGLMPWRKEREELGLADLNREFRAIYDRLFGGWPTLTEEFRPERPWNVEVEETEKEFVVRMEAPGFEAGEFVIEVRGDRLSVKAEHSVETKGPEGKEPREVEKRVRRYERVLTLPEGIDLEKLTAAYRNGMLELHLPRAEEAVPRRIPVNG